MIATLGQGQADLPRLVELASQGEDVLITVDGKPKARLTGAEPGDSDKIVAPKPMEMARWLTELEELRRKHYTGKTGLTSEQILEQDRRDRV